MEILLIRHEKVGYPWKGRYTSAEFDRACLDYDRAPLLPFSRPSPAGRFDKIYVSRLSRSRDTARVLFPGETYTETDLLDEVPLRSAFEAGLRLPLWLWNAAGRFQWLSGSPRQKEGRPDTEKRAAAFVRLAEREGRDCAAVTHGFYMQALVRQFRRAGFRPDRSSLLYRNGEGIRLRKEV